MPGKRSAASAAGSARTRTPQSRRFPAWPTRLQRRSAWRYAWQHPWQTWLGFLGIALGVMMVVAVDLASSSARRAFSLSLETVTGTLSHQIVGGSAGVPDTVYTRLRTELGLRRSAPSLSGQVQAQGREFTLLGVDAIAEATLARQRPGLPLESTPLGGAFFAAIGRDDAVLMSERTAMLLDVGAGDPLTLQAGGQTREVHVAALFSSANPAATEGLVLADIAVAQLLLGRLGYIDSIDLVLTEPQVRGLQDWLPPGVSLVQAGQRQDSLQHMSEAFHINLLAMSLLSLLVAALLIYNTMSLSVLQRQPTLGIFRSQGVSRREIFCLILGEAAALGLLASLAGIAAGLLLGQFLVGLVTRTIDDLYFNLMVSRFLLDPAALLRGLALGLGVSLLAAGIPAWQAMHSEPVTLQQRAVRDKRSQTRLPWMLALGALLLGLGLLMLQVERGTLVAGFIALTLVIFGFCLLVPALVWAAISAALALLGARLGSVAKMALRGLQRGISRTGLAVAALCVAISVTVGVGVMVSSFRATVGLWLDQSLAGDLQISRNSAAGIDPGLSSRIAALEGVAKVQGRLQTQVESEFGPLRLEAGPGSAEDHFYLKQASAEALAAYAAGAGILVSEPLAWRQGLEVGDRLTVFTDQGAQAMTILGILHDYTSSVGLIALHERLYRRWWDDYRLSRLTVTAQPGVALNRLQAAIHPLLAAAEGAYRSITNGEIRALTLNIFDRTFAITNVLRLLAIVVAFVGVLCALMALQLERLQEFALLRATGMTPRQVAGLILAQTGLIGAFAGLLALPLGLLMADILIDVINARSFGWSMQQLLPVEVLWEALLLALLAALLAGLYPAWRASAIAPAQALREE